MTILDSYKKQIYNAFINHTCLKRDVDTIKKLLSAKVHGSNNVTMIPPFDAIEVERVSVTEDKVSIVYDDITITFTIVWRVINNGELFAISDIRN